MPKYLKATFTIGFFIIALWSNGQQPKLMLPIGHTGAVNSASFSPDGKNIVTASGDGTAKIWDAVSGALLADLKGHSDNVSTAAYSADGKKIVTASFDHTAKVWDAGSGVLPADLKGHTDRVNSASFSPDGKKIVTASWEVAKIWDAETGALLADLKGHYGINSASFSPDGKKIVTASYYGTAKIWNAGSGTLLADLKGHSGSVKSAAFSPDGKKIVTASNDRTAKIWGAESGALLADLKGHSSAFYAYWDNMYSASFSPDGKEIVTASGDGTAKIWNATSGALLVDLKGHSGSVQSAAFFPDGKKIITTSEDGTAKIWDATSGALLADLKGHSLRVKSAAFSPDGKKIVTASSDKTAKIWDAGSGALLVNLKGHSATFESAGFSLDGKKIVTNSGNVAKVWDAGSGTLLANLIGHRKLVNSASFSPDGKKIVTASDDITAKIWDATSGVLLADLKGHSYELNSAVFSPDGKKIVTVSRNGMAKIWDAGSGALLADLKGHNDWVSSATFSPDGKKIVTASGDRTAKIWDAGSGALLANLKGHDGGVKSATFSPDGKKIVTASWASHHAAKIWDVGSGALLADLKGHNDWVSSATFSPDGKKIVTASGDVARIWDAGSGALLADMKGHSNEVNSASFSPDGKKIVTASEDNTMKIWEVATGKLLYTLLAIDSTDYLVFDSFNHYDGTPGARNLLYYTCGTEIIGLDQVKDKLWVPNLVERIMKGEKINAPSLTDLDICGLTPLVEPVENITGYQFKINPRRGGLGETILFVNGIETKKYKPEALTKKDDGYELSITKQELSNYFVSGKSNEVSVKSYTKQNDISSRGVKITYNDKVKDTVPPNLYAVIIGVSDYKGNELNLKYAAKDAADIGNAVSMSASKLLGKDHVFMYNLNTGKEHYAYPEKKSIKDVFTEIGKKATANDVLMVFFAGHGVVMGEKKQFYFLTADASRATLNDKDVKDVGIGATELMEWMKPNNIKAQKRILILDACNSGQAINQIVSIGQDQNYVAVRNDDKAEEIKQIEKLNEKSGLYVLAASASNQSAYEMGRYNQGLLTYSLLKVIKEHPEVLEENKYLNVSGWFNAATKIVTDIVRENNLRQEPQLITTTNFNIGIVDNEVLAKIILPSEKPLFTASNFQNNDPSVIDDDLGLTSNVNQNLGSLSARGTDSKISFINTTNSPDAWTLVGRYDVKGDDVIVHVNMKMGSEVKNKFEIKGKKANLKELAKELVSKATELIVEKK